MTAYTVASAILISSCFMNRHAFAAAQPVVANLMQGVQNAQTVYSAGQQAFASMPDSQFNVTEIFQELLQARATIVQRAQGGNRLVEGKYGIGGNLCVPKDTAKLTAVQTIEILTHGVGLEKSYWDIAPGYATFAYDRLGVGQSDHPDPIQVVQAFIEVEIIHGLAQLFRKD